MGKFFGTYERTLDDKHRLQVPTKLVGEVPPCFYILKGFEGCLSIYLKDDFDRLMEHLSELSYTDPKARSYIRLATSSVAELPLDSHGRISISTDLAAEYGIKSEVTIIGVLDHFELWDREAYKAYRAKEIPSYEELAASTGAE